MTCKVRRKLGIALGITLGHKPRVTGLFVNDVRVVGVKDCVLVDGVGRTAYRFLPHLYPLCIHWHGRDVLVPRIAVVWVRVADGRVPLVVKLSRKLASVHWPSSAASGAVLILTFFRTRLSSGST